MNLRRDTVKKEALYVAPGLDESGRKEILGVPSCGKRFFMN